MGFCYGYTSMIDIEFRSDWSAMSWSVHEESWKGQATCEALRSLITFKRWNISNLGFLISVKTTCTDQCITESSVPKYSWQKIDIIH